MLSDHPPTEQSHKELNSTIIYVDVVNITKDRTYSCKCDCSSRPCNCPAQDPCGLDIKAGCEYEIQKEWMVPHCSVCLCVTLMDSTLLFQLPRLLMLTTPISPTWANSADLTLHLDIKLMGKNKNLSTEKMFSSAWCLKSFILTLQTTGRVKKKKIKRKKVDRAASAFSSLFKAWAVQLLAAAKCYSHLW